MVELQKKIQEVFRCESCHSEWRFNIVQGTVLADLVKCPLCGEPLGD